MKLDVIGQQFILDSQINTIQNQSATLYDNKQKTEQTMKQKLYETDRKVKDISKAKNQIEMDCRNLTSQLQKEMQENYSNTMHLDKNDKFGKLKSDRFELDKKLTTEHEEQKTAEKTKVDDNRNQAEMAFKNMSDLQSLIKEANDYKSDIEDMHVKLAHLQITIKTMEDTTEYLTNQKEDLDDRKKATEESNEDLTRQLKAKEEANTKRMIAKLQRDKNPQIKELMAQEESQIEANEDFANKLREETEKHNTLLDELIQLKENFKLTKAKETETIVWKEEQSGEIGKLTEMIKQKQEEVNGKQKVVTEQTKVNVFEKDKNMKYAKANAALLAKLEFIESKYDYSS